VSGFWSGFWGLWDRPESRVSGFRSQQSETVFNYFVGAE